MKLRTSTSRSLHLSEHWPQLAKMIYSCVQTLFSEYQCSKRPGRKLVSKHKPEELSSKLYTGQVKLSEIFAAQLIDGEIRDEDEQIIHQTANSTYGGYKPEVLGFESIDQEIKGAVKWLINLIEEGYEPKDIAIFGRTKSIITNRAIEALETCRLAYSHLDHNTHLPDDAVSIGTLHQSKGIEFRAVLIMGCEDELIPLSSQLENNT